MKIKNKIQIKLFCFNNFFNALKLYVLMIVSVVGVGFISGAEVYRFFVKFGNYFWLGIFVFFLLMFALIFKILSNRENYQKHIIMHNLNKICSKNTILFKFKIKYFLTNLCYVLMAGAMISGLKTLIKKLFFNNYLFVLILSLILVFVLLYFGVSSLAKFDGFVLLFVVFVCVICITKIKNVFVFTEFSHESITNLFSSIFLSVCYVFMNIIQIKPFAQECEIFSTTKGKGWFSFFVSVSLSAMLVILCLFLKTHFKCAQKSMPLLFYFINDGEVLKILFPILLFVALISSLMSSLFGLKKFLVQKVKANFKATFFTMIISFVLSFFEFKFYISFVYPLVGILNFIIFVFL